MNKNIIHSGSNHDFAVEVSGGRIRTEKWYNSPDREGTLAEERCNEDLTLSSNGLCAII